MKLDKYLQAIPIELRSNFIHLYFDIAWFGVLSGSAINFLNVYATRIGATGYQIGLLGATSAIVSLIFSIPAGHWLENNSSGHAVFWASVIYRFGFLLYIPLPWLFGAECQINSLIILSLLMGIPLVGLSVGFGVLFAEAVPFKWRAQVAGTRNIILSVMFMVSSLGSGYLLNHIIFPLNYQIVFMIGLIGAGMSSYHLFFIKPVNETNNKTVNPVSESPSLKEIHNYRPAGKYLLEVNKNELGAGFLQKINPFRQAEESISSFIQALRLDIWSTPFRWTLLVMMAFHIAQYLALPVFPLYLVRNLNLSDQNLGIGSALFYLTVLLGSTKLHNFVHSIGHKDVTAWGVVGMAIYPILMAFSSQVWHYYIVSILGGLAWALVGGASMNYIIEKCPELDRRSFLAWYNVVLNASILIGSIMGPAIAESIGIALALVIFGLLRGLSGLAILKWG